MKGMILKDLYTVWRTMRPLFIILLPILVIGIFLIYHDASVSTVIMTETIDSDDYLFPIHMLAFLSFSLTTSSFMNDKKCGWLRYALTMPITRREYFHAKLLVHAIFCAGLVLIGMLLSFISLLVAGIFSPETALNVLKSGILSVFFWWLTGIPICALMIRYKYDKAIMIWAAYALGTLILSSTVSFLMLELMDLLYPALYIRSLYFLLAALAVCMTIGTIIFYRLGVKWMERKGHSRN
ncbi:MAG: ABC-2 transporter permease [Oscillospiraceae bacterium]|nr:ABC-2 transporter permease [Oscillospiraceae bacterium]